MNTPTRVGLGLAWAVGLWWIFVQLHEIARRSLNRLRNDISRQITNELAQVEKGLTDLKARVTSMDDRVTRLNSAVAQHLHPNGPGPMGMTWPIYAKLIRAL